MQVFICPRDWVRATERFTPTHLISLQNPRTTQEEITDLRPPWIVPENHYTGLFWDADFSSQDLAPSKDQIEDLIHWLQPRCGPSSESRFLVHCDAGLGRSPATGYILWALHLGPGQEEQAFRRMIDSALERQLVPNSAIIAHADDILHLHGALKKPLTDWNARVPWRRTFR